MTLRQPKRKRKSDAASRSPKQEAKIARTLGGRVTKASGAGSFEKGDVRINGVARIEAKTTNAASFRVTGDMIDKIEGQAMQGGEVPVIVIEIEAGQRSVAIMPMWALESLISDASEKHSG